MVFIDCRRYAFQNMNAQGVISSSMAKIVVQSHKPIKHPLLYHSLNRKERQSEPLFAGGHDMHDVAKISGISTPAFGSLLVGKDLDERKTIHLAECRHIFNQALSKSFFWLVSS